MASTDKNVTLSQQELEALSARWDRITYHTQGSPLEDLSVRSLANSSGSRPWSRPKTKAKFETLTRYIYLSFEELLEVEKLELKAAIHLLEICESTMLFMQETCDIAGSGYIDEQATSQRMRFVEEYGLNQDFPIHLANLDSDLRQLCESEEVGTLLDLMGFIDSLSEKAWLGGSYRKLQNIFAHGDEKGLREYFPYRIGYRGFHLTETLAFCLKRLKPREYDAVVEYHVRRQKKSRFGGRAIELPSVVESQLLPEILECISYYAQRQRKLTTKLYDSAYVARELMFLDDPEIEGIIHWLLHLALGIFRPSTQKEIDNDLKQISVDMSTDLNKELSQLFNKA